MSVYCLQPVAILWDIENCAVPRGVNAEDVAVHIRMALKVQLASRGPITVFSAYGDFSHLSPRIRQGCQRTGVKLIDIPHGSKDAADKAILVDMFLFAFDNPPPCTVVLISGDVDFAPALHKLGQRGYCVVLAIPSGLYVSPALCNACQYLWSWPDVARGKGLTSGKTPLACVLEACKPPSEMIVPNARNIWIDQVKDDDYSKSNFIDEVKSKHHGFDILEAGPSGMENACEVPRKLPVGMFEEYVKVSFLLYQGVYKDTSDHNGTGTFDMNRSAFPPSYGTVCPVTSHSMTSYEDVAPLTAQALNHEFVVPYPDGVLRADVVGQKGLAHCNTGMHDDVSHVVANRPAWAGWHTNPSFQPRSRKAKKRFANFKRGKSARKQVAGAKSLSLLSEVKKKKKWEKELWPHPPPKQLRRSKRLAARQAQGM